MKCDLRRIGLVAAAVTFGIAPRARHVPEAAWPDRHRKRPGSSVWRPGNVGSTAGSSRRAAVLQAGELDGWSVQVEGQ